MVTKKEKEKKTNTAAVKGKGRAAKTPRKKKAEARVIAKSEAAPEAIRPAQTLVQNFVAAVGRRKTARARVRMTETGQGSLVINGRALKQYFTDPFLAELALSPLKTTGEDKNHDFSIKVAGGGVHSQAEAVRHGLARVLIKWNDDFRKSLRAAGYLTRDSREKERKKPGLKKARKAPQWQKR